MENRKITEIFGLMPVEGDVGIEIEAENHSGDDFPGYVEGWRAEEDGSLRGESVEYVLKSPCKIKDVKKNLDHLSQTLKEYGTAIDYSFRAGVHIHINMQQRTMTDVVKFAGAYYMLEECLFDWCGTDRVGNHFCLRACDAEYVIDFVSESIRTSAYRNFGADMIRYAGLNFNSLPRYGSLEFRGLGTEPDFSRIEKWANMLYTIRANVDKYEVAGDMLHDFSILGPVEWAENIMGEYFSEIKDTPNLMRKLSTGMRMSQDFIFQSGV